MTFAPFRAFLAASMLLCSAAAIAQRPPKPAQATDESQLKEHGHYKNKKGEDVHSPAHTESGAAPNGATAKCRDGTYSFSRSRSGTCSRHGGVGAWLQ